MIQLHPLQSSVGLTQLIQAARAGREEEVLDVLLSLVASLGGGSPQPAANGAQLLGPADGHLHQAARGSEEEGAPGSIEPCDRGASGSLPGAGGEGQRQPPGSGSSGSGGAFAAMDVWRWKFDYSSFHKLRPLGEGSFGKASGNPAPLGLSELPLAAAPA